MVFHARYQKLLRLKSMKDKIYYQCKVKLAVIKSFAVLSVLISSVSNCHSELGKAQGTIRDLPSDFYYANISTKKLLT